MSKRLLALSVLLACAGDKDWTTPLDDSGSETDADTDADTDSDTDADTDTDSDADTDTEAHLRVLHVAPGLPPQDLLGNGNPGSPAMVGLEWLGAFPAQRGWVTRPPNEYTFELFDSGETEPWTSITRRMNAGSYYSLVLLGQRALDTGAPALPAPEVLAMEEPMAGIPFGDVRIRWTHAAVTLADRDYALRDALTGATYATLGYGAFADTDQAPTEMNVYVDLDDDGACDPGEAFQSFTRSAGEYFHVLLVADDAGSLLLVGHADNGLVPTRGPTPCP